MKSKNTILLIIVVTLLAFSILFVGCKTNKVEYGSGAEYDVSIINEHDAVVYKPSNALAKRGVIFYVGTALEPKVYENLAKTLARAGYYAAFPKVAANLTYLSFKEEEKVIEKLPKIKFAVAGHSQGGGAAAKRLLQEKYFQRTVGGIFLSPLFYKDTDLSQSNINALLIEAEFDKVLNDSMKKDARAKMPLNTKSHLILGGNHMGYSGSTFFADGEVTISQQEQQEQTSKLMLEFLEQLNW